MICRLYDELTEVNDEIGDLEDRLAALKDRADTLGKKYIQAKKESEKADKEVQVNMCALTQYLCAASSDSSVRSIQACLKAFGNHVYFAETHLVKLGCSCID